MAGILRGDILWADLNPSIGHEQGSKRPILVLSNNVFNDRSGTVVAVAITSRKPKAGFPLIFRLSNPSLPKKSWVKISRIRTLSSKRIRKKITRLEPEELTAILSGLNEIIG